MGQENILIWLPSPMGDAILCTPALRAIRRHLQSATIWFYTNDTVRQVLSPCDFNDYWLHQQSRNPFTIAKKLKQYKFTQAILLKNSFASALAVFLAGIPARIGYAREGRGLLLTERLQPPRLANGRLKPFPMTDYYLAVADWLGADTNDKALELSIDPIDNRELEGKLPKVFSTSRPIVILVPGGAFGPSKCWPAERFAQTADWLTEKYHAMVIVCVAPNPAEKKIAGKICSLSNNELINLAQMPLTLGELKGLFALADLVVCNDTGPRHIAIALKRKVITLFGPNDPAWTNTDYDAEIQIVSNADCAPCEKAKCTKPQHLCMEAITVEMVTAAAAKLL